MTSNENIADSSFDGCCFPRNHDAVVSVDDDDDDEETNQEMHKKTMTRYVIVCKLMLL